MQPQPTSYDLVAYPVYTHLQTHPSRLAVIGSLFGMSPAPVNRCRVLELGCGTGSNLAPMAATFPESEFVGIDLAAKPVSLGTQMIQELGMKNIRLVHGNVTSIDREWGQFDYIIAHGLFSWVPAEVREHVLKLCHERLAPQGIAFISYNAYPGCHMRNMLREMMLFHVQRFESPDERVRQAKALARFVAEAQDTRDEYRLWMKSEFESVLDHDEGHLYHDELAEISVPLYFHQFVETAAAHNLQYVGEADYFEMFDYGFNEPTRQTLEQLSRNRILREQYLDFLKCRRFRQTLLCHRDIKLSEPQAARVRSFLISSSAKCTDAAVNLHPGATNSYRTAKGAQCTTDFALGKTALGVLEKHWPMPVPFPELLRAAQSSLSQAGQSAGANDDGERLETFLLELYSAGVIELHAHAPLASLQVSERPRTTPLVRWQAQRGNIVTSQFHMVVKIEDEVGRCLLSCLDGTRDHQALAEKIWQLLKSKGALAVPDGNETAARHAVETELAGNLKKLARMGLLAD
ncbi:MAG TPA: class I SAM-dependent methyltransferase [Verrucomicrobiae bacterium]|jgi:SAM-dependent methyltransferase|nr:class I SAM-dependent methyltransferase [Verrucomicrobiae bacterium]